MTKILFIGLGGALGAVMRYLVSGWGQGFVSGGFPVGTLLVNTLGCMALGFLGGVFAGPALVSDAHRLALTIGLLGGFTTFSTYAWETVSLLDDGQNWQAFANVMLSNALGLVALWIGYRVAGRLYLA